MDEEIGALPTSEESAISTPEAVGEQAPTTETSESSFTELNPDTLPPELQELWNQTYKSLQGDYTRKTQDISSYKSKATAYDELMPYVQQLIAGDTPGTEPQAQPQQSGEELLTQILENPENLTKLIQEEAKKLVDPLYQERSEKQAETTYNELLSKYPDLPQYEDKVAEYVLKGYDPEDAYRIVTYDARYQAGVDKGTKATEKRDGASSPTSANTTVTSNKRVTSFEEAFERAKKSTGWNG